METKTMEKTLDEVIRGRRATPHFQDVPIAKADLEKILEAGRQAPSGYNLQPWRFVVVQEAVQKKKLQEAAFGQPKIAEASAMIVACGDPQGWKNGDLDEAIRLARAHGYGDAQQHETTR